MMVRGWTAVLASVASLQPTQFYFLCPAPPAPQSLIRRRLVVVCASSD
jgi:hypothetical protein